VHAFEQSSCTQFAQTEQVTKMSALPLSTLPCDCDGLVVKPLLSKDFNCRGQVDLVDMQSMPDGDFKFIMHYQDHLTNLTHPLLHFYIFC
jgi:hypothetical protein